MEIGSNSNERNTRHFQQAGNFENQLLPTTVGINPWVFSRNKDLYGKDADEWRPERWLEYSPEHLRYLETYNVIFGTGARSCPGKHLVQAIFTKMLLSPIRTPRGYCNALFVFG